MGQARAVPKFLFLVTFLAISVCFVFAQDTAPSCSKPAIEVSNISRPTGVLRADPNANETASQKIVSDAAEMCRNLSDPAAMRQVRMKISDNNIIVSGSVPTDSDAQQILAIVAANADGRTVFNRLEVVPMQMARRQ